MNDFINENINIITAIGVGATIYGLYLGIKKRKRNDENIEESQLPPLPPHVNISPSINIVNNSGVQNNEDSNTFSNDNIKQESNTKKYVDESSKRQGLLDELRKKTYILFIDDDKNFAVVNILKQSGWKNTKTIVDIKTLDILQIREADIIFIDINGVGKLLKLENEGLDIALMLKRKYPNKKVIIYSANRKHDNFHEAWSLCDYKLEKNALPFDFINLVENYSIELNERG